MFSLYCLKGNNCQVLTFDRLLVVWELTLDPPFRQGQGSFPEHIAYNKADL